MQVFINCPFDEDYRPFLNRILFVLIWAELEPVLLLDFGNKNRPRFERIKELLNQCPISIHDLSRNKCSCGSSKRTVAKASETQTIKPVKKKTIEIEYYRLNMPLELGYAMACADFAKEKGEQEKRILIMANHRTDVLIAANDINNYDPEYHGDEVHKVTSLIRNFIIQETLGAYEYLPEKHKLEELYMDFEGGLNDPMITTIEIKKKISKFISKEKVKIQENEKESNSGPAS